MNISFSWGEGSATLAPKKREGLADLCGNGLGVMARNRLGGALLALLATQVPVWANDGYGGLSATGLTFGRTDAVAMEEEELFISLDRVEVNYLFRNKTDSDVTGEVIFPMPPIALADLVVMDWNLPEDRSVKDILAFTAEVDGKPVAVNIDLIAVIPPKMGEDAPVSASYDTPGRDVTALLEKYQIPIGLDAEAVLNRLAQLDQAALDDLQSEDVIEFFGEPRKMQPDEIYAKWSVVYRYHWTQTFPAKSAMRIKHGYDNRPSGGIFTWTDPPKEEWNKDVADKYCIDAGTSKGIMKALGGAGEKGYIGGGASYISYVLRTANSWAGPISKFKLTLDKGDPKNIISLCADGLKKVTPTRFVMEKTDFSPDKDLEVLVVYALDLE